MSKVQYIKILFSGCDCCEEWYHGDCINITEKEAKHIKHYYCQKCKEEDPSLQTVFRTVPVSALQTPHNITGVHQNNFQTNSASFSGNIANGMGNLPATNNFNLSHNQTMLSTTSNQNINDERKYKRVKDKNRTNGSNNKYNKSSKDRCGHCTGCRAKNCGECTSCLARQYGTAVVVSSKKYRCEKRQCINQHKKTVSSGVGNGGIVGGPGPGRGRPKKKRRTPSPEIMINPQLEGQRQCYGPSCKMTSRPQSKYCSDICGMKLATSRIYRVLPQRIQEWNLSACNAEEKNKKILDQIRAKQLSVRATLAELDKRQKELDLLVDRAKRCSLDPTKAVDTTYDNMEDEMSMYCITCGHEIHSKTAIRHMEKCFNKYESQASFGSSFKSRIDGNTMFCDFYNTINKTYCKRLRVLCPEHCKDAKVNDSDVCGCPLVHNVFQLTGEFCRAPKKNCFKHYVWEKIRRAEIDLERVRQWLKMDELMEQERQVRSAMASRASVLGLMLHSTYNHEIMEKLCAVNNSRIS